MRKQLKAPSPSMVISLIALLVALGGTGYAAGNAILSSPSKAQIIRIVKHVAPSLSVKSAAGLSKLPSGKSESGLFTGGGSSSGWIGLSIMYPRPLAAPISDSKIVDTGAPTLRCTGPGHADPGYLCLYDYDNSGTSTTAFHSDDGDIFPVAEGKLGVDLYWATTGSSVVGGSWTVTAP